MKRQDDDVGGEGVHPLIQAQLSIEVDLSPSSHIR
jgi:hypothetical protein